MRPFAPILLALALTGGAFFLPDAAAAQYCQGVSASQTSACLTTYNYHHTKPCGAGRTPGEDGTTRGGTVAASQGPVSSSARVNNKCYNGGPWGEWGEDRYLSQLEAGASACAAGVGCPGLGFNWYGYSRGPTQVEFCHFATIVLVPWCIPPPMVLPDQWPS